MGLKEALLDRLGDRSNDHTSLAPFSASLSNEDKLEVLVNLVDQTVLPRRLTLSGDNAVLSLQVANKHLFGISGIIADKTVFEYDFAGTDQPLNAEKKIVSSLTNFFEKSGPCEVEFVDATLPEKGCSGLSPKSLLLAPPAIQNVEKPRPKVTETKEKESGSIPLAYLAATSGDIRKARHYSFDSDSGSQVDDSFELSNQVEKDEFSGLNDLHEKFSPLLGKELLFVVVTEGSERDAFAFAINGEEGVSVELDRQKIGKTCQAWRKATSS